MYRRGSLTYTCKTPPPLLAYVPIAPPYNDKDYETTALQAARRGRYLLPTSDWYGEAINLPGISYASQGNLTTGQGWLIYLHTEFDKAVVLYHPRWQIMYPPWCFVHGHTIGLWRIGIWPGSWPAVPPHPGTLVEQINPENEQDAILYDFTVDAPANFFALMIAGDDLFQLNGNTNSANYAYLTIAPVAKEKT